MLGGAGNAFVTVFMLIGIAIVGLGAHGSGGSGSCNSSVIAAPASVQLSSSSLSPSQLKFAALIAGVAETRNMTAHDAAIGIATAAQESSLSDPPGGDLDSIGLFQQRPSQGWGPPSVLINPVDATNKFFDALVQKVPNRASIPISQAAQDVQASANGALYQKWAPMATQLANQAFAKQGLATTTLPTSLTSCQQNGATLAGAGGAGSAVGLRAVHAALTQVGVPYVWGGTTPYVALDCSGLVQYAYQKAGVTIPRVANDQYNAGHKVSLSALQPGDLLFENWNEVPGGGWGHVGMYIGNNKVIQAPQPGQNVEVVSLSFFAPVAAARPV